jgi:pimeloyl-[acyl-carrier protein] methyl ester esterase
MADLPRQEVIAMHGWGGDSCAWEPWHRHFDRHGWHWQSGERGYGGRPLKQPQWHANSERRVLIGHSLGPHLVQATVLCQATDVVLLASFGRFIPTGAGGRALRTALNGMHAAIGTEGETAMLTTFLARAADPANPDALPSGPLKKGLSSEGRDRLRRDLERLSQTIGLPDGIPTQAKVLVVEAGADAIVSSAASRQLLLDLQQKLQAAPEHWTLKAVGHALPVPDLVCRVQRWLDGATSS